MTKKDKSHEMRSQEELFFRLNKRFIDLFIEN